MWVHWAQIHIVSYSKTNGRLTQKGIRHIPQGSSPFIRAGGPRCLQHTLLFAIFLNLSTQQISWKEQNKNELTNLIMLPKNLYHNQHGPCSLFWVSPTYTVSYQTILPPKILMSTPNVYLSASEDDHQQKHCLVPCLLKTTGQFKERKSILKAYFMFFEQF